MTTKVTEKNRRWVAEHPNLAVAIANLRGQAGMSERAIVETMRGYTRTNGKRARPDRQWREDKVGTHFGGVVNAKDAPSYGDVRAAFETFEAKHLTIAGERKRRIAFKDRQVEEGSSAYRRKLNDQFSANQVERHNRKTVVGYMIQAEIAPEEWADPDAYIAWEKSQEYDRTPPF